MTFPPWIVAAAKTQWKLAAVVAIIGTMGWFAWRNRPQPIPPTEQHSLDSSTITAPAFQKSQAALVVHETTFVRVAAKAKASADTLRATVDTLRRTTDSLAILAGVAADTAHVWRSLAVSRGEQLGALTAQRDSLASYGDAEHQARLAADTRADDAMARVASLTDLQTRLAKDLKNSNRCRIAFVFGCPSRKVVFVGGLVVGGVLANDKSRHALVALVP